MRSVCLVGDMVGKSLVDFEFYASLNLVFLRTASVGHPLCLGQVFADALLKYESEKLSSWRLAVR